MNAAVREITSAFISSLPPGRQERARAAAPQTSLRPSVHNPFDAAKVSLEAQLGRIHPSWFSKETKPLYEALSCNQSLVKNYCIHQLAHLLEMPLPQEFLPPSSLLGLLSLSVKQIDQLCELLGLYDLSSAVKKLLDASKLKALQKALKPFELARLKTLQDPLQVRPLDLGRWSGEEKELRGMLSQRGLSRLSNALYGEDAALCWHLAHRMEKEKGELLLSLIAPNKAAHILASQVLEALQLLTQKRGP